MTITKFTGEYVFLNTFYDHDVGGYPTLANFIEAFKLYPNDPDKFLLTKCAPKLAQQKTAQSLVIRSDWEQVKNKVLWSGLKMKFADPDLRQKLIDTHPHKLVFLNHFCETWLGICSCDVHNHVGNNALGLALGALRESYIKHGPANTN